jgi:hypothetical protein
MNQVDEERVLDESPVKKFCDHGLLTSFGIGTSCGCDSIPELFVVFVVGDAPLADF